MKVKVLLLLSVFLSTSFVSVAQDYDDIYYDSSKASKKEVKKNDKKVSTEVNNYVVYSDNSNLDNGNWRDVDEYNRRYTYNDTLAVNNTNLEMQGDFVYTDRLRRFYNPSVIVESNDPQLAELYYVSTTPEVNLIIGTPTYYWNPFGYYWYSPSYYWHYGWYDPMWHYSWHWDWWYPHYPHYPHNPPGWHPGGGHYPGGGIAPGGGSHRRPTYNAGGRRPFGVDASQNGSNAGRRPSSGTTGRGNSSVNNGIKRQQSNVNRGSSSSNNTGRRPSMSQGSGNTRSSSSSSNRGGYSSGGNNSRGGNSGGATRGGSRGGRR